MPSKYTKEKLEWLDKLSTPTRCKSMVDAALILAMQPVFPGMVDVLEFTLRFECLDGVDCPPCLPAETITRLKVGKPPAEASFLVVFQHAARLISEDFSVCLPFLDVGFDWLHVVLSFIDRTLHPLSRVS